MLHGRRSSNPSVAFLWAGRDGPKRLPNWPHFWPRTGLPGSRVSSIASTVGPFRPS